MSNFKHPQYLTPNGLMRMEKKPVLKKVISTKIANEISSFLGTAAKTKQEKPSRLRLLAEKRVMAKRIQERQEKGISEEAAKAIAEAIKTLLHS